MQVVPLSMIGGMHVKGAVVIRQAPDSALTDREVEVLRLVAAGMTNGQIAETLDIARRTVASHVEHILTRTGAANRTAAAVIAAQIGLLEDGA